MIVENFKLIENLPMEWELEAAYEELYAHIRYFRRKEDWIRIVQVDLENLNRSVSEIIGEQNVTVLEPIFETLIAISYPKSFGALKSNIPRLFDYLNRELFADPKFFEMTLADFIKNHINSEKITSEG